MTYSNFQSCACPACFIIPSYINLNISRNGSEQEKRIAVNTIEKSARIRERRSNFNEYFMPDRVEQRNEVIAVSERKRKVYDSGMQDNLPGKLVRSEGSKTSTDRDVNNAYNASGIFWKFMSDIFNWNGWKGNSGEIIASVHYEKKYNNAFFDGTQIVFGDGDGVYFNSFTTALEITAHELFHGVISRTSKFAYRNQSGALNESYADVFGIMCKQWRLSQTVDESDWVIGKGLFTPKVKGKGVRILSAPGTAFDDPVLGKDKTVGMMSQLYTGTRNFGGIHTNNGIPSRAFYQACKNIAGDSYSWETMGQLWWFVLVNRAKAETTFEQFVNMTLDTANLPEFGREYFNALTSAWRTVGLY